VPESPEIPEDPAAARLRRLQERKRQQTNDSEVPDPAGPTDKEVPPVTPPVASVSPSTPETAPAPVAPQPRGTVAGKEKLQPYVAAEIAERARNAWYRTRSIDALGFETFSDLIEVAIREKVEALEREYNAGQPFTARPSKKLSSGRPVGR
jgi:hypothetical protein